MTVACHIPGRKPAFPGRMRAKGVRSTRAIDGGNDRTRLPGQIEKARGAEPDGGVEPQSYRPTQPSPSRLAMSSSPPISFHQTSPGVSPGLIDDLAKFIARLAFEGKIGREGE